MIMQLWCVSCSDQGLEMGGLGSRRESQSGDKLTFESSMDAPPQRRRRRKKTATTGKDREPFEHHKIQSGEVALI